MKHLWPCLLFLMGNEIVSYLALLVLMAMFFRAIIAEANGRG